MAELIVAGRPPTQSLEREADTDTHQKSSLDHKAIDASLLNLPIELITKIVGYLPTASGLAFLGQSCKRLHELVDGSDCWHKFCLEKFPTLVTSNKPASSRFYKSLAEQLTGFSQAWQRRTLSATLLERSVFPSMKTTCRSVSAHMIYMDKNGEICNFGGKDTNSEEHVASDKQHRPKSQTISYRPQIVSRVDYGTKAQHHRLTVAWSTGAAINVRVSNHNADGLVHREEYFTTAGCFKDGRDDITSLNMIASPEKSTSIGLIISRASGHIHRIRVDRARELTWVEGSFRATSQSPPPGSTLVGPAVRASDLNGSQEPLLAVVSDHSLWVFETCPTQAGSFPVASTSLRRSETATSGAYAVKFLAPTKLVIGSGHSANPITYCTISESTIDYNTFGYAESENAQGSGRYSYIPASRRIRKHSVFAIEPLACERLVAGGSAEGTTFLTGWYDGFVRLYDTRASQEPAQTYHDVVDIDGGIYSLAAYGHESFLAGTENAILKFFDFRMNKTAYNYTDAQPCSSRLPSPPVPLCRPVAEAPAEIVRSFETCQSDRGLWSPRYSNHHCEYHARMRRNGRLFPNMNVFLYGHPQPFLAHPHTPTGRRDIGHSTPRRITKAPIYSLSIPSSDFSTFYAGTEGAVYEFDIGGRDLVNHRVRTNQPYTAPLRHAPGTAHVRPPTFAPLQMYETSEGLGAVIDVRDTRTIPKLRHQRFVGDGELPTVHDRSRGSNTPLSRLDRSWLTDAEDRLAVNGESS